MDDSDVIVIEFVGRIGQTIDAGPGYKVGKEVSVVGNLRGESGFQSFCYFG